MILVNLILNLFLNIITLGGWGRHIGEQRPFSPTISGQARVAIEEDKADD